MIFLDTSGLVAAVDRADERHNRAKHALNAAAQVGERLVTTTLVVNELATVLRRRGGHEVSTRVGDAIFASRALDLVVPRAEQLEAAHRTFCRDPDPALSFTDAVSFVVMRDLRIRSVLGFDPKFAAEGFELIP